MIDQASYFFIFFGGFMSWTIALGMLLENEKKTYHYMFAGLMFSLGVLQLLDGLLVEGRFSEYSWLIFWHMPFMAWIGPLFFFTFKSANNDSFRFKPADYLHFSFGIITIPLLVPLVAMDAATKLSFIMSPPHFAGGSIMFRLYSGLLIAAILNLVAYMLYFTRECFFMLDIRLIREKKVPPYFLTVILISFPMGILYFSGIVLLILAEAPQSYYYRIIQTLTALSFVLTLAIFIMEKKNINFFKILHDQIENRRYEISKIKNLDVALVLSKIKSLMEDEKVFFNEDITLNDLAREISIEPYQLSQIINENFNKNFNCFINEYRIEEAKRILLSDMDRTVISVAYAVGFNSTTVFYNWFTRLTGVSPKKFRSNCKSIEG